MVKQERTLWEVREKDTPAERREQLDELAQFIRFALNNCPAHSTDKDIRERREVFLSVIRAATTLATVAARLTEEEERLTE